MLRNYFWNLGVSIVLAVAAVGTQAPAQTLAVPPVPDSLKVPDGNSPFLKASASGTQNYVCLPAESGLAWKFQGPQATLFVALKWFNGEMRQQIATHFLSPSSMEKGEPARATWQSSLDSSAVWAKKIAETADSSVVAPGAIPWFLLEATGVKKGPSGGVSLAQTTYIQRVNTTGGMMPTTGCNEAGAIQFVPYTAEYIFYRANGSN